MYIKNKDIYLHIIINEIKKYIMTTQEINTNIERLENTIKMNIWNKGYVANCKTKIENYRSMLQ